MAADLLNWGGSPHRIIKEVYSLLDDPHYGVRNQLSRFMIHYIKGIKDESLALQLVATFLLQLDRPSHGDRNKALINLNQLIDTHPRLIPFTKAIGGPLVETIAVQSILENVGGEAKKLLLKLNESESE